MKRLLGILAALLMALPLWAQSTIRVEVHNIVELSERFNVVFVVEGEHSPSDFEWNAGDDFTTVWGPQKGSSTSIQMVNGKTTRSSQTSYTYILQARKTGTFTLPAATAKVKGSTIQSRPVSVQVVDNGSRSSAQGSSSQGADDSSAGQSGSSRSSEADIFMRLTLSRSSVV